MITSTKNERIKEINKLKQKKYRDETHKYLVEGFHMVEEAIKYGQLETVITTLTDYKCDYEIITVNDIVMNFLSSTKTPQPIMGICVKKQKQSLLKDGHRYVLLDNIQDPGNLGTIIRTAYALNVDQLILSNDTVDLYNDKVLRSTQGGIFKLNIIQMDLTEAISLLQSDHIKVYGSSLHHASSIKHFKKENKMAFVLGNEGNGIKKTILDLCDDALYIPMNDTESLNVAIAASIIIWHFKDD